jgi:hypothetical protein
VLLSSIGSLGYALSLFFITIIYTPLTLQRGDSPRHDTLFTPYAFVYDVGIVASLVTLNLFPELVSEFGDKSMMRVGYLAMPLAFAFAPQVRNALPTQQQPSLTKSRLSLFPLVIIMCPRQQPIARMPRSSTHCHWLLFWCTGGSGRLCFT